VKKKDTRKGHRERLRKRFLKSGLSGFHDYEIIELLLTYALCRRDVKPLAKALIERFGGLRGVFDASLEDLRSIKGIGKSSAVLIKLLKVGADEYLKEKIKGKEVLSSLGDVLDYFRHALSGEKIEKFMAVYLNTKNRIVGTEVLHEGTIDQAAVYPRQVIEGAIRNAASAIIFVHNHPSGDPSPSPEDRAITESLSRAAAAVDIAVHDHVIIGCNSHFSARRSGWFTTGKKHASGSRIGELKYAAE